MWKLNLATLIILSPENILSKYSRKTVILRGFTAQRFQIVLMNRLFGAVETFPCSFRETASYTLISYARFLFHYAVEDISWVPHKIDVGETSAGQLAAESCTALVTPCQEPQTMAVEHSPEVCWGSPPNKGIFWSFGQPSPNKPGSPGFAGLCDPFPRAVKLNGSVSCTAP